MTIADTTWTLADIRRLTPGLEDVAYFQTSGFSPKPEPVTEEVIRWLRLEAQGIARPSVYDGIMAMLSDVRQRVAALINADPGETVLTNSVTTGTNTVAYGIDWQRGENVVISDTEHPTNQIVWYNLARRAGIEVRVVPVARDDARLLDGLARRLDGRTRLVSISHVSRQSGRRLPAREMAEVAHRRGVPILLDGAQAIGAIPVDVQALGCDFYAFGGHKYLMAPSGTGALYVARERLEWLQPTWVGSRVFQSLDEQTGRIVFLDSARRFEPTPFHASALAGLGKALELWGSIGWPAVHGAIADMASRLKQRLRTIPGLTLHTPLPPEQSAGVVTFSLADVPVRQVVDTLLAEDRILLSPTADGVRVSVHVFNTDEEMERLLAALRRLAALEGK